VDDRVTFGGLPHQERGCCGGLVGNADLGRAQRSSGTIRRTTQVKQARQPSDAYRRSDRTEPPSTPKTVVDDDADIDPKALAYPRPEARRARVRIGWKQKNSFLSIAGFDVGRVDACIRQN
jgi:hypothetical protein